MDDVVHAAKPVAYSWVVTLDSIPCEHKDRNVMVAVKEREWCFAQYNECCVSQFNDLWEGKDIAPQCQSWYIQCFRVAESACYSYWIDNQVPVHKWVNTIACVKAQKCSWLSLKSCKWFLTVANSHHVLPSLIPCFLPLRPSDLSHCYIHT